ncbi:MAG TPA: thymidylate synthase [Armatimonadota bacterium]|nr:thymidylate synthase [Armatimonadota bacterium]HOP80963.1 thymidylate synthase [Armatimonadota bacterium]HPP75690.1 thymidylate synthase [Armatimonadota bacterium]
MKLDLPIVCVTATTLPEAWETAVVRTWMEGTAIETEYDKPGDPPSRDATAIIAITEPLSEPRIHRAFPGGIAELEAYRQEVVDGIHDHWVDPDEGKWEYTYHERLAAYSVPGIEKPVNQLDYVVEALAKAPHTRRAQAITWKPWEDAGIHDPACLQRLWFRVFGDRLVMNAHMRSNDAFKAGFMNMYAFTDLQRVVAEKLSERLQRQILPGQYTHVADSFHIYGSYFPEFEGFLNSLKVRTFEDRTFRTEDVQELIDEAKEKIRESLEAELSTGRRGL